MAIDNAFWLARIKGNAEAALDSKSLKIKNNYLWAIINDANKINFKKDKKHSNN